MVSRETFREMALSFADTEEMPHFHITSFRIKNKIFATLWGKENRAMIKLPLIDQSVVCSFDDTIFSPVPGSWGTKGATFVDLKKVNKKMLQEALTIACERITKKK